MIRRQHIARALVGLACILAVSAVRNQASDATRVEAQIPGQCWSTPSILFETSGGSMGTALVADGAGQLHAFWASNPFANPDSSPQFRGEDLAIYYARWDGESWSTPVDIVADCNGMPQAVAEENGTIHLFWRDSLGNLRHSWSRGDDAVSAQSWTESASILAGPGYDHGVTVDQQGDLHLVYSDGSQDIMYVRSSDGGHTWSLPTNVSQRTQGSDYIHQPRVAVDDTGGVHVVWAVTSATESHTLGVFYANSADGGMGWSVPVQIAEPWNTEPNVATLNGDVVHVVWNGQNVLGKRFDRWSDDGGLTWSDTYDVAQVIGGILGPPAIAVDSAGIVHVVVSSDVQIYYNYWDGRSWSEPKALDDVRGRDPVMAVTEGNYLHVLVNGMQKIVYMNCRTSAPFIPSLPLPTPTVEATPVSTQRPAGTPTPLPVALSSGSEGTGGFLSQPGNTSLPVVVGLAPVLVIISALVLIQNVWRRR